MISWDKGFYIHTYKQVKKASVCPIFAVSCIQRISYFSDRVSLMLYIYFDVSVRSFSNQTLCTESEAEENELTEMLL